MSSIRNKRQQARNERILQDLLKSVPGNDQCADCGTKSPAWASWSLGIFLCMRCASLHRKLGTHISKVKSISMDMWTNDQNMRSIGNAKSNGIHNPDVNKHPIPLNTEDSDSQMERHIRNKYEYKLFVRDKAQPKNSSTSSVSSGASSSFGATSSTATSAAPPARSVSAGYGSSRNTPFRTSSPSSSSSKVSQVLGVGPIPYTDSRPVPSSAPVVFPHGMVTAPQFQEQLQSLKDMGFKDEKKMVEILKSVNGRLLDAADIMLRLGSESSENGGLSAPEGSAGITIQKSGGSANPFDALDRELPPLPPGATKVGGINPQALPAQAYQNSYQAPAVAPAYGSGQPSLNAQKNLGGYGQAYGISMPQQQQLQQLQQQQQQPLVQAQRTNPYASYGNFASTPFTGGFTTVDSGVMSAYKNPFMDGMISTSQNIYQPPPQQQQQQQQQHNPFLQQSQQPQQQLQPQNPWPPTPANPSYSVQPQMNPYLSQLPAQPPQQQQIPLQRPGIDKSSILALYNFPHLAPQPNGNPSTQPQENQPPAPQSSQNPNLMHPNGSATAAPTPTSSAAGSNNPFLPATSPVGAVRASGGGRSHMSQESVDFGAWQSGRHSPDAFASLSFRQ